VKTTFVIRIQRKKKYLPQEEATRIILDVTNQALEIVPTIKSIIVPFKKLK